MIRWQDIKDIQTLAYNSARGGKFRSQKIFPTDFSAYLARFSPIKRLLIRMATAGCGPIIDIPQVMLNRKVGDILAEIEQSWERP